jgi:hypothetical protein
VYVDYERRGSFVEFGGVRAPSGFYRPVHSVFVDCAVRAVWAAGDHRLIRYGAADLACGDVINLFNEVARALPIAVLNENVFVGVAWKLVRYALDDAGQAPTRTIELSNARIAPWIAPESVNTNPGRRTRETIETELPKISAVCAAADCVVVASAAVSFAHVYSESMTIVGYLVGHLGGINCVARVDAATVATGSADCTVRIWDVTAFALRTVLYMASAPITHLFHRRVDGLEILAAADEANRITVWDITKQQFLCEFRPRDAGRIAAIGISADCLTISAVILSETPSELYPNHLDCPKSGVVRQYTVDIDAVREEKYPK